MEVLQFRVLKGVFGRFAGFVLDFVQSSRYLQKGIRRNVVSLFGCFQHTGVRARYLRNVVSWYSFIMRGSQV
jgi:hypothetical protein